MVFKQAVTAEDMFLGMGRKNATTACCEDLVVRMSSFRWASLVESLGFLVIGIGLQD